MTATAPRLAGPPDGVLAAAERAFGLPKLDLDGPLAGGYANDVFSVRAGGRRLVLRVEHPPVIPESLAWEHRVVTRLAETLAEVPAPLRTTDGATFTAYGRFAVSLLPFVAGRAAGRDDALGVALALGRLHRTAASLALDGRPRHPALQDLPFPDAGRFAPPLAGHEKRIGQLRARAVELVRTLPPLATGLVHGDLFPGNVLVRDGRVTALLDWEEAHVGPQAWDVAAGVWEFARDRPAPFLAAYREEGGTVPADEDELLRPLIGVKRILEVLRAPTDRHVDWDYQLRNLEAAERLV